MYTSAPNPFVVFAGVLSPSSFFIPVMFASKGTRPGILEEWRGTLIGGGAIVLLLSYTSRLDY